MKTYGLLTNNRNIIRSFTVLLLFLLSIVTTATCNNIFQRFKRGTVKVGDLPQIKPPVMAKKGEPKYPSPGWTHCIKYLTADVRWRSIKSVNLKKLQATQFQCSWYISSEVPGTQVRVSFEKLDFGGQPTSTCTQQFLEIIDIKVSKSQGRICGERVKKMNDYVSAGQRLRIDIQGEEPLVEKIRAKKEPFIISYKLVREPAGFRIATKNKELTNKVKNTVGSATAGTSNDKSKTIYGSKSNIGSGQPNDNHKTIYGSKNQPGIDNSHPDDPNPNGRSSLTIWQVIIIIFVSLAIVSCIIGVIVKRMVFDKKKKEEYLSFEAIQNEINHAHDNKKALPGINTKVSHVSEEKKITPERKKKHRKLSDKQEAIPRSSSKPEGGSNKTKKMRRHNSHGDLTSEAKTHQKKLSDSKKPLLDGTRVHGKPTVPTKHHTLDTKTTTPPVIIDDTPSNRAARKTGSKDGDKKPHPSSPTKKSHHDVKKHTSNRATKTRKPETDENKNNLKQHRHHKCKTKERTEKPTRPRHRKTEHMKDKNEKKTEPKTETEKDDTPPSRAAAKRPHPKKHVKDPKSTNPKEKTEHKHHKNTENTQRKEVKKRKSTVSSGHKKTTTSHGKKATSSHKTSSHHHDVTKKKKRHHDVTKEHSKSKDKTNNNEKEKK